MSMENSPPFPALVIAGMHRSGTSLAASLVASAGVHLGERLMGPERGNPLGHFEDLDFYELHQRALAANGLGREGFTCQDSIAVPPAVGDAFDLLIKRRRGLGRPWGWKDPRTTLFLEAWRERLPEAVFLLVFRRPWEVVDSLLRRGDTAFAVNPRLAADVWLAYNRRLHDFFLAHRDRCLLVETARVARDPAGMIADVGRLMGVNLEPPEDRYEPGLLVEDASFDRAGLVRGMRPEAIDLYESLRHLAGRCSETASMIPAPGPVAKTTGIGNLTEQFTENFIDAAAMQWVRAATADELSRSRAAELAASSAELAATSHTLATTSSMLATTVAERDELARTLACRSAELATERDAALGRVDELSGRLAESAGQIAVLEERLCRALRKKTIRERLSIEGHRIARQAVGLLGTMRQARQSRGV